VGKALAWLGECAEGAAEFFRVEGGDELLNIVVGMLPDGNRAGEERFALAVRMRMRLRRSDGSERL